MAVEAASSACCFNEARADSPGKHVSGGAYDSLVQASMRPGRMRPGNLQVPYLRGQVRPASMRPGRIHPGNPPDYRRRLGRIGGLQ